MWQDLCLKAALIVYLNSKWLDIKLGGFLYFCYHGYVVIICFFKTALCSKQRPPTQRHTPVDTIIVFHLATTNGTTVCKLNLKKKICKLPVVVDKCKHI